MTYHQQHTQSIKFFTNPLKGQVEANAIKSEELNKVEFHSRPYMSNHHLFTNSWSKPRPYISHYLTLLAKDSQEATFSNLAKTHFLNILGPIKSLAHERTITWIFLTNTEYGPLNRIWIIHFGSKADLLYYARMSLKTTAQTRIYVTCSIMLTCPLRQLPKVGFRTLAHYYKR